MIRLERTHRDTVNMIATPVPTPPPVQELLMRFFRLGTLALLVSFALAACSSPTAAGDDCTDTEDACYAGFPTSGS